ncbi:sodium:solute symporter family protein [uncultured Desulfuromusa sp.]|uniref:sodium:solute symporter family protein n=1 Tax=uncultured Desulfuromusa sp. TaxID=219183 RepID=UPI002AA73E6A|nr:sodium:solute symporter family protein [uncultured Desulfuromusa sp.]
MSSMAWLIIVIGSYMLIVMGIGFMGYRKSAGTAEDYYMGGRALGTLVLTGTSIATYASLWTFLGAVGGNYRMGITFISMMMMWNLLWPLLVWFIGTKVWLLGKKFKYITYSELINDYYDTKGLGVLAAVFGIMALIPYIAVQLMGGGIVIETFTNGQISFAMGVTITFIFMVLIISLAGLKSVVWTDTLQGLFFLTVLIGMAVYALMLVGGAGEMFSTLNANHTKLLIPGTLGIGKWLGFVLTWGLSVFLPHMFQRLMMAKDPKTIAKVSMISSVLSGFAQTIPVFIIGICCVILLPGVTGKETDAMTILFANKYLSPGVAALVIGGAFAAGTSTLNSQLLTASSLFLKDLIINPFNLKLTPAKETLMARLIVIMMGAVVLIIALTRPGLIIPISTAGTAVCISSYLFPAFGILFWRHAGKLAAYASLITAGIVALLTWLVWPFPLGIYNVLWGYIAGGIAFAGCSLFESRANTKRQLEIDQLLEY